MLIQPFKIEENLLKPRDLKDRGKQHQEGHDKVLNYLNAFQTGMMAFFRKYFCELDHYNQSIMFALKGFESYVKSEGLELKDLKDFSVLDKRVHPNTLDGIQEHFDQECSDGGFDQQFEATLCEMIIEKYF